MAACPQPIEFRICAGTLECSADFLDTLKFIAAALVPAIHGSMSHQNASQLRQRSHGPAHALHFTPRSHGLSDTLLDV